jgi:3-deoxy-D-manno-octulosonic-acid transferase
MKIFLWLYNLLFPLALLVMLPGALWRMVRRGNYAHKFGQRFALYSRRTRAVLRREQGRWIWVHAVSVGEVNIALSFIREIQARTDVPVLLSTTTSTGFALASKRRNHLLEVVYHPVDFYFTAVRALGLVRPQALVLVEAEVWPNLTTQARSRGIPVVLINARLSSRSERRFLRFKRLTQLLFGMLDRVCVQGEEDVLRYVGLGVPEDRIRVTGSIKFDLAGVEPIDAMVARSFLVKCGWDPRDPVLLAASTHAGEEVVLARVFLRLRNAVPGLRLILVPRHAERSARVRTEVAALGLKVVRRTEGAGEGAEVLLVDTTGELRCWMETATLVFIGKSLLARGGQNPAEAIAAGKPVVVGPDMSNFSALIRQLQRHEAICRVEDEETLESALRRLLQSPELAASMAERALAALLMHRGATGRTCEVLAEVLPSGVSKSE